MSRIGNKPVEIPEGVTPTINGQSVLIKGSKGELSYEAHQDVKVILDGQHIVCTPRNKARKTMAIWPTTRTRIFNLVEGVTKGFEKVLELKGVGYRAQLKGNTLVLALGYSHDVEYNIPDGIKIEVDKQTTLKISGIDKQKVGQVANEIRQFRKPEPYKGKGIRYQGEQIMMKEGKKK